MLTILEASGEGNTRGEFTMEQRHSGASTHGTPRGEVSDVVGGDIVGDF